MIRNLLPSNLLAICLLISVGASQARETDTLAGAYEGSFKMGAAIGSSLLAKPEGRLARIAAEQFNSATPENCMKWSPIHPSPGNYNFADADRFVELGVANDWWIVGHTLIWHQQTPEWVFVGESGKPLTRDQALARMRDHIQTVVGRYRGRVHAWDVVNEALNEDGSLRDTKWRQTIGDDYLQHAFRFAAEADPDAELYYNDYNLYNAKKAAGAVRLAESLKEAGCRIDGIGIQGHWAYNHPPIKQIERSIRRFSRAVDKVMITELDVNMLPWPGDEVDADVARKAIGSPELDPYTKGLPPEKQRELADRYVAFFRLFLKHQDVIDRVTFWGIDDGGSWHNYWPINGRTAHSLLFDRGLRAKPAFDAVIDAGPN